MTDCNVCIAKIVLCWKIQVKILFVVMSGIEQHTLRDDYANNVPRPFLAFHEEYCIILQ